MVAEQNLIGEMLTSPEIIDDVSALIEPQMFTSGLLGMIYHEIVKAHQNGVVADPSYIVQHVSGFPEEVVQNELYEIIQVSPLSYQYKTDMKVVYDDYTSRLVNDTLAKTVVTSGNVYEQVESLRANLDAIAKPLCGHRTAKEIANDFKERYFRKHEIPLMKTGFQFLDDMLGGLEGGDLVVIGARPAVGKSAFAIQMASQIADNGFKPHIFNLEMTEKQMFERMVSYESGISQHRLRVADCFKGEEERIRFNNANIKLATRDNLLISTGSRSIAEIRREVRQSKPDIVIIDYLQLLKPETSYKGNRYAEVGAISHAAKALAMEMNIPVVILSQLNRMSESRDNKEPSMAEIRESGDVEQDAGTIILLWNKSADDKSQKGCVLCKNRNGETGKFDLVFNGAEMRFEDAKDSFVKVPDEVEYPFDMDEG